MELNWGKPNPCMRCVLCELWTNEYKQRKNFSIHSICSLVETLKLDSPSSFQGAGCVVCVRTTEKKLLMVQQYSMLHHLQIAQSSKSLAFCVVCVYVCVFTNLEMAKWLHVLKAIATGKRNKSFYFISVFISVSRVRNGNFIGVCKCVCVCVSLNMRASCCFTSHRDSIYLFCFIWKDFWSTLIQVDLYPHNFVFTKLFHFIFEIHV